MALFAARGACVDLVREGAAHRIVDGATFELEAGGVYDLVGPSGSGKSTLLRACALMVNVAAGSFELDGKPAAAFEPAAWRAAVSLVPQKAALVAGTVRANLALPWRLAVRRGATTPSDDEMTRMLAAARIDGVDLERDVSQLSGGQAARVALVRSFLTRPRVLLLDEVDAALDDESSAAVSELTRTVAGTGTACLRIRHRSADGLAVKTFVLENGRLAAHE